MIRVLRNFIAKNMKFFLRLIPKSFTDNDLINGLNGVRHYRNISKIIESNKVDLVLDIGANYGIYSLILRNFGYSKDIIAFEPVKENFRILKENLKNEKNIKLENKAVGDKNQIKQINVLGYNKGGSSFLEPTNHYKDRYTENVNVVRLDDYFDGGGGKNIFLKADVQGYEDLILKGAKQLLKSDKIKLIQLELSTKDCFYKGQSNFYEVQKFLENFNFRLVYVKPNQFDNEGILEGDFFFSK